MGMRFFGNDEMTDLEIGDVENLKKKYAKNEDKING